MQPGAKLDVFSFLRPYRLALAWLIALTVGLSVLAMLPPLLMRAFIDRVLDAHDHSLFMSLGICMVVLPITIALCGLLQTLGLAYVGWRYLFDIRIALYDHIQQMSMRFFGKNSTGKLVNRLMTDTSMIGNMLGAQTISIVADLVCATFAVTATFAINWRLGLILLLIIVLFSLNWHLNISKLREKGRVYWQSFDRLSGGIQNRIAANLAVKTFGTEDREQTAYRGQSSESMELLTDANIASISFSMNTMLIQSVGRAVIYFLACALVLRGDLSYGDVVAFTTYAMQLLWPAIRFSEMARQFQDFRVACDRISEILTEQPEVTEAPNAVTLQRLKGQVDFERIGFQYEPGRPVLIDFDLHVKAGQTIALIGPTGCGKSTVLSLLLRFFDVTEGRLLMDGTDIRQISLRSLRRQFGIVLQEPLLFNVSIAENIRYARPEATQAEVEAAAKVAEAHDLIMGLPERYNSIIGSDGVQLSVGQKQRLTIARAVVADPAILIMDEATSALDSESERAIQTAMARVLKGRTSFIVAHRLSTIKNADLIIVLDKGRILESGNHEQLIARPDGHYRDLYNKFMSKGVIDE